MPLYRIEHKFAGNISIWQLTEDEDWFRKFCAERAGWGYGPDLWTEACSRFKAPERRKEWVVARLLLSRAGIEPDMVAYKPSGQPYVVGKRRWISISHTKGYVAVKVSDHGPVGVDIERRSNRVIRVAERFMEGGYVPQIPDEAELARYLLLHWSARESMYKCLGQEGVDFKAHLHVGPFGALADEGKMYAWETRTPEQRHFEVGYEVTHDYVLTWCHK